MFSVGSALMMPSDFKKLKKDRVAATLRAMVVAA